MKKEFVVSELLGKKYLRAQHESGLEILLYPMPGFSSNYALFGTKYGSIDNEYTDASGNRVILPEGIAHFLEHKLFESEDGDAFDSYAKTGAYANAYTSFDRTCYLFSCSNKFYDNLGILLDFVRSPYFTEKTVLKEQGIIGQEIRMYRDMPNWRVMLNMLNGMYHNHPVKIDIPGTEESISNITDKLLYGCYEKFYNLSNMFLIISGDFDTDEVLEFINKNLKSCENKKVNKSLPPEPETVVQNYIEQTLDVSKPLFCLGFKENIGDKNADLKDTVYTELLLKILVGTASPLYKKLLDENLINEEFGMEYFTGRGFAAPMLEGESDSPKKIMELFLDEVEKARQNGIDTKLFEAIRREIYGKSITRFDGSESVASMLCDAVVQEYSLFDYFEILKNAKAEDIEKRLDLFRKDNAVLSVVKGK